MGVMRFLVHPPDVLAGSNATSEAYLSGLDARIFPTHVELEDNLLTCRRMVSDSAKLNIAWPVAGVGAPVLTTASLREREQPYILALELARGKLSEVRETWAAWEQAGMSIPDAFRKKQKEAFHYFAQASAAAILPDQASEQACQSIKAALEAASMLIDAYTIQRMTSIRRSSHQSPGLLGGVLNGPLSEPAEWQSLKEAFNTVSVPINWREIEPAEGDYRWDAVDELIESAAQQRFILKGGPLIDLGNQGLPDWLAPWKNDFLNLPSFVCDYIDTAVGRYQGLVRLWEVSAYGNTGGALELGEDHCLALVARTLEAAKRVDSDSQLFVRIERPWGEYLREGQHRLSPFQFVDALVRSNLGLAGVTLELNCGYGPEGCFAREMLSVSKLIDFWSLLGVQVHVNLACPAQAGADPLANDRFDVRPGVWRDEWNEETQAEWMEHVVPLLLAKPSVTGVFLSQLSDAVPHRFPHAGLLNRDAKPRPMLQPLLRIHRHKMI